MEISVIIPVYNAEKYIKRAVDSALEQKECAEIILVDDKSPDNALEVCQELATKYDKISVYQHENGQNMGPGHSRNLGVLKSKCDCIAFLDADDVYLPGRFEQSAKLMKDDNAIDGVYEPVDSSYVNEEAKKRFVSTHEEDVAMVTKDVEPDELFEALISGKHGYIHPNGLLLRKQAFIDVGMYPDLRLHEDTILILKLSMFCKLVPGVRNSPVSTRLLHMDNTITKPGIDLLKSRCVYYDYLLQWMERRKVRESRIKAVKIRRYVYKYRLSRREKKYFSALYSYLNYKWLS